MPMPVPKGTPVVGANTQDLAALQTFVAASSPGGPFPSADQGNWGASGIKVVIDVTAFTGAGAITVTLQGKDMASGKYYTILASAALGAVATTVLTVFPGAAVAANVSANDQLPENWRVSSSLTGAGTVTATVGACLML